tara:strand:+ start:652 stop:1179 length:528 start_codon:yes stop_codon:yes gene_type:complete
MSSRGSSVEKLQENRDNNRFGNFLSNFLDRTVFGSKEGRQLKYDEAKKDFLGFPLPEFGVSEFLNLPDTSEASKRIKEEKEGKEEKLPERDFLDENKQLLKEISNLSEQARDKAALRTGISNLALSPLIGGQAAMDAAAEINRLTIGNMGAMAAQNRVLEANPMKQKIAGKYFRL